jgi:hypothetical protein
LLRGAIPARAPGVVAGDRRRPGSVQQRLRRRHGSLLRELGTITRPALRPRAVAVQVSSSGAGTAASRPLRKSRSARARRLCSRRSGSVAVSRPAPSRLAPPAVEVALRRHCNRARGRAVDDKSDRADAATAAAAVLVSLSARTGGEVGDAPEILVADAEQGSATADRAAGVRLHRPRGRRGRFPLLAVAMQPGREIAGFVPKRHRSGPLAGPLLRGRDAEVGGGSIEGFLALPRRPTRKSAQGPAGVPLREGKPGRGAPSSCTHLIHSGHAHRRAGPVNLSTVVIVM